MGRRKHKGSIIHATRAGAMLLIMLYFMGCSDELDVPPLSISEIPNQKIYINQDLGPIDFTILYTESNVDMVTLKGKSDNTFLISNTNIEISGTGSERTLTLKPSHNESGKAKITLSASDGILMFERSFEVRVVPVPGSWSIINTNFSNDINKIIFHDTLRGWAIGKKGLLLSSLDGGYTWNQVNDTYLVENFNDIYFTNRRNGWIASTFHDGEKIGGQIIFTSDSGKTWSQKRAFDTPLNAIHMFMGIMGWAAGNEGLIAVSPDGGNQWITRKTNGKEDINDIFFINNKKGWAVGEEGSIYISTNGGADWTKQNTPTDNSLQSVFFIDEFTGYVCGSQNTILKTETGGLIWLDFDPSIGFQTDIWKDIFFINENTGWLVGLDGRMYLSKDGGASWNFQQTGSFKDMNTIFMLNEGLGWIGGEEGSILKYE